MKRGKPYCCLVVSDHQADMLPAFTQNEKIEFIKADNTEKAFSIIRNRFVDCLVLPANRRQDSVCEEFGAFTAQFPAIPILVIIDSGQIELACRLGQLGAKHVVAGIETDKTEELLLQIVSERHLRGGGAAVDLRKISIPEGKYDNSPPINRWE